MNYSDENDGTLSVVYFTLFGRLPSRKDIEEKSLLSLQEVLRRCFHSREFLQKIESASIVGASRYPDELRDFRWLPKFQEAFGIPAEGRLLPDGADTTREALLHTLSGYLADPDFENSLGLTSVAVAALVRYYHRLNATSIYSELEPQVGKSSDAACSALANELERLAACFAAGRQPSDIHAALRAPGLIDGLRRSMGRLPPESATLVAAMLEEAVEYARRLDADDVTMPRLAAYYALLRGLADEFEMAASSDPSTGRGVIGGVIAADGSCASLDFRRGVRITDCSIEPFSFVGDTVQREGLVGTIPFLDGETGRYFMKFASPVGVSNASLYVVNCDANVVSLVTLAVSDQLQAGAVVAEKQGQENEATFLLTSRHPLPAVQLSDGVAPTNPVTILQNRRTSDSGAMAAETAGNEARAFAVFDRSGDLSLVADTGQVLWTGSIAQEEGVPPFVRETLWEIEVFAIENAMGAADIGDPGVDRQLHFVFDLRSGPLNRVFEQYLRRLSRLAKVTLVTADKTLSAQTVETPKLAAEILEPDDVLVFVKGPAVVPVQALRLHLESFDPKVPAIGTVTEMAINVVHDGGLALAIQPSGDKARGDVFIAGQAPARSFLETGTMKGRALPASLGWRVSGRPDAPEAIVLCPADGTRLVDERSNLNVVEIHVPGPQADGDALDQTLQLLEGGLKRGLPVIFLGDLDYPPTYVRRCIDAYHRYGGADLVTAQIRLGEDGFQAGSGLGSMARRTAPAALTCLSPASALEHVRANSSRIFDALVHLNGPMLVASILSASECGCIFPISLESFTPAERMALHCDDRARWNPLDLASDARQGRPIALLQSLAMAKNCIKDMGRARDSTYDPVVVARIIEDRILENLVEIGYLDLAQAFLTELSRQDGQLFSKLSASSLIILSEFCLRHGVGADFAAALAHEAGVLLEIDSAAILPVANLFVSMLDEEQISAAFTRQALASAAGKGGAKSALRLIEAAKRYLGDETFLQLNSLITSDNRDELLGSIDFRRHVAERVLAYPLGGDRAWGGSIRDSYLLLPPRHRLLNSLNEGDLAGFRVAFTDSIRRNGNAGEILDVLRSFTFELSSFGDENFRKELYRWCDPRERLILATILSDRAVIADHLAYASELLGDGAIVCNSVLGDNASAGRFLSERLDRHRLRPWRLAGDDLIGLFDHALASVEEIDGCPSRGKVSIIMSAFNSESTLMSRAIKSVLLQSYGDFELLVVDDASNPSASREIEAVCQGDQRIRVIRLPLNQGPYIGRNIAMQIASGEYVAIHDSDDLAHPQRLQFQVESLHSGDVLMVTADHSRYDVRGSLQFESNFRPVGDGTMTSMFRRELFDKVGPFLPVRSRGDVEFRERVVKMLGPVAYRHVSAPLMLCYASPGTLSNRTNSSKRHALQLFRTIFNDFCYASSYSRFDLPELPIPLSMRA